MNYPEIETTIGELRRYVDRGLKKKHPGGAYVRSTIIPRATKTEQRKAEKIADPEKPRKIQGAWVPLKYIVTEQSCLLIKSLRYALRTYIKHQKAADKLPTLVHIGRCKYVLWDGNHRTTIGLMIDPALSIRALVIRQPSRKKALTRRAKHG